MKPSHAMAAVTVLVARTPYLSMLGRIPAIASDMIIERKPLEK